jgi:hypothetical protein
MSAASSHRRMAVVCAWAQCRATAICREGVVLVEWEGGPPTPLLQAVAGLDDWGNVYRVA